MIIDSLEEKIKVFLYYKQLSVIDVISFLLVRENILYLIIYILYQIKRCIFLYMEKNARTTIIKFQN